MNDDACVADSSVYPNRCRTHGVPFLYYTWHSGAFWCQVGIKRFPPTRESK